MGELGQKNREGRGEKRVNLHEEMEERKEESRER